MAAITILSRTISPTAQAPLEYAEMAPGKFAIVALESGGASEVLSDAVALLEESIAARKDSPLSGNLAIVRVRASDDSDDKPKSLSLTLVSKEGDVVARLNRNPHSYQGMTDAAQRAGISPDELKFRQLTDMLRTVLAYAKCYITGRHCHTLSGDDSLVKRFVLFHWNACGYCHQAMPSFAAAMNDWDPAMLRVLEVTSEVGKGLWDMVKQETNLRTVPTLIFFDASGEARKVTLRNRDDPRQVSDDMRSVLQLEDVAVQEGSDREGVIEAGSVDHPFARRMWDLATPRDE